jgi:transcriptional regulator with XRE-family HTH domain
LPSSDPVNPQLLFGQTVRQLRLERGYSQEKLAELAGIHRNYAGAVERGERNVALVNMVRIAQALGVPLSRLVEGIEEVGKPAAIRARRKSDSNERTRR